ncbi:ABC transporter substrate-binding protein [Ensifer sp. B1-9]|uniref:ABC transporter substrate-binding protein n=1 Tax=Ensifer sp. B1-9 TaxID=3141455 RepID=UPI003D1E2AF8
MKHSKFGVIGSSPISRRGLLKGAAGAAVAAGVGGTWTRPSLASGFTAERSFKIGFIVPLTGPISPEGEAMRRGLELGLAKINASGGLGGKPVEMVTQDNQSQPSMASMLAKKFIQQEKVDLIVGTVTYDETTAVRGIASIYGTPFVQLEAGNYAAAGNKADSCGGSMIPLGETVLQMVDPIIPFMTSRFGKKWAFVGSDYQFPRDYTNYAKAKLAEAGGTVVAEEFAPLGTGDWSSVISKLKAAAPDVVLSSVVGGDAIAFIKAADSLGLLAKTKVTGISLQPEFYPALGSAVDGQFTVARYTPEINNERNAEFIREYRNTHGEGPIPSVASAAFDCWNFIRAAVQRAGSFDADKVLGAFDNLEVRSILSEEALKVAPASRAVDYPMYICEILPGGTWKIAESAGVLPSGLTC